MIPEAVILTPEQITAEVEFVRNAIAKRIEIGALSVEDSNAVEAAQAELVAEFRKGLVKP